MKKTKVGQVYIKLNAKGQAKESYKVTKYNYETNKHEETGEIAYKNVYTMAYQPRKKLFKGTNNYFDPVSMKAVSYGWWTYVTKIKGKVVFNDYNYSVTTSGHQNTMRYLLKQLGIKVDVWVNMAQSLTQFETHALRPVYQKLYQLEIEVNRKNSRKDKNKERQKTINTVKNHIKTLRKLGAVFTKVDQKNLKDSMLRTEEAYQDSLEVVRALNRQTSKDTRSLQKSGPIFNLDSLNNV